jgi:hypothetical protein
MGVGAAGAEAGVDWSSVFFLSLRRVLSLVVVAFFFFFELVSPARPRGADCV